MKNPKPIFKYIGGKRWMQEKLREKVSLVLSRNPSVDSYTEPFCGGLGSFLSVYDILIDHNIKTITLNDINSNVVNFYIDVRDNPLSLISKYFSLEAGFFARIPDEWPELKKLLTKEETKIFLDEANNFYKQVRDSFNSLPNGIDKSAHLLFLQKHAFNGVYRENKKGGHNVPFNWSGDFVNKEETQNRVLELSSIFNSFNIILSSDNFSNLVYKKNTLYYLDPPYLNENGVENKYNKSGFSISDQRALIYAVKDCPFVYSNHYSDVLIDMFVSAGCYFDIDSVNRKNIMTSSKEGRGDDKKELILSSR